MRNVRAATKILLVGVAVGCWTGAAPPPSGSETPSVGTPAPDASPPISVVTAMVVVDECPDSRRLNTKVATREIDELVGPCKTVPGGAAHFSATLRPGGKVTLASPSGDPHAGVVPTCLVQKQTQLRHKLRLTAPCKFDVNLEERTAHPQ